MPQPNPSGRGPSRRESVLKPPAEAPRATTSKSPPERCRGSVILPAGISDANRIGDSGTFSPHLAYLKGADVSSNLTPWASLLENDQGKAQPKRKLPSLGYLARLEVGNLEVQNRHGQPVLVVGLGIADLRLGLLQLCLAQFHDGSQAKFVAGLRKVQRQVGLLQKLTADVEPLISRGGVEPAGAHVAGDTVLQVSQLLLGGLGLQLGFTRPRGIKKSVEDRHFNVHTHGPVPRSEGGIAGQRS